MKKIIVYTKDYCPYCVRAKRLLDELGADYEEIDITQTPEAMEALVKKSGMMTVPQIFVGEDEGEKCLGGSEDIHQLHREGKLLEALGLE